MIRFIKNFINEYYELDRVAEKLIKKEMITVIQFIRKS